jgi:hypothetical protein
MISANQPTSMPLALLQNLPAMRVDCVRQWSDEDLWPLPPNGGILTGTPGKACLQSLIQADQGPGHQFASKRDAKQRP